MMLSVRRLRKVIVDECVKQKRQGVLVPTFVVVRHKDKGKTLMKTSHFLIHKAIVRTAGNIANITTLCDASVLVEIQSRAC